MEFKKYIWFLYNVALILALVGIITFVARMFIFVFYRSIIFTYVPIILIALGLLLQKFLEEKE